MFYVGQKVVCVDDGQSQHPANHRGGFYLPYYPKRGQVYTIRALPNEGGILLVEVRNPVRSFSDGTYEGNWNPSRFRPIVEKKTDISILTALLNPANHKKLVDA